MNFGTILSWAAAAATLLSAIGTFTNQIAPGKGAFLLTISATIAHFAKPILGGNKEDGV